MSPWSRQLIPASFCIPVFLPQCFSLVQSHLALRGSDGHPFRGRIFGRVARPFHADFIVVNWRLLDPRRGPCPEHRLLRQGNARGGQMEDLGPDQSNFSRLAVSRWRMKSWTLDTCTRRPSTGQCLRSHWETSKWWRRTRWSGSFPLC